MNDLRGWVAKINSWRHRELPFGSQSSENRREMENSCNGLSSARLIDLSLAELQLLPEECPQLGGRRLRAEQRNGHKKYDKSCGVAHSQGVCTPFISLHDPSAILAAFASRTVLTLDITGLPRRNNPRESRRSPTHSPRAGDLGHGVRASRGQSGPPPTFLLCPR